MVLWTCDRRGRGATGGSTLNPPASAFRGSAVGQGVDPCVEVHRRAVIHRIAAGTLAAAKVGDARTSAYIIERAEVERIKATDLDAWVDSLPDG